MWYNIPNDNQTNLRSKAIILITDGCNSGSQTNAEAAVTRMRMLNPSVKTYVVGFGSGVCAGELNGLATAGGTSLGNPGYYDASNAADLADDLRTIITSNISCSYNISTPTSQFDPNKIWVSYTINGQTTQVAEGAANGYVYDSNSNTLTINGSNCTSIQNADPNQTSVDIVVGCRTDCTPSMEVCDYIDNDCDGDIDEIAACQGCVPEVCDGQDNDCDGVVDNGCAPASCQPEPEICGDNIDNDCDGDTDEDCGMMSCVPQAEICGDGMDNDCDMEVDEGCPPPQGCVPSAEICDGVDNNCNMVVDEGCPMSTCIPSPEICDGQDNDCDMMTDEGCAPVCTPENEICDGQDNDCDGVVDNDCVECPNGRSDETCDGVDNDCDGEIDEGCGAMCVPQNEICDGLDDDCDGVVDNDCIECPFGRNEEICNGGDDDCDGEVDEGCSNG